MKKSLKGFTLVEVMVILVILGILITIGVANFTGYVEKAQFNSCLSDRQMLESLAVTECKINPQLKAIVEADSSAFFKYVKDGEEFRTNSCICGGEYSAYVETTTVDGKPKKTIKIRCSFHDDKYVYSYLDNAKAAFEAAKEDLKRQYVTGDEVGAKFKEQFGGKFPETTIDGKTYYIQVNKFSDAKTPVIYLATSSSRTWKVNYIYIESEKQWYKTKNTGGEWLTSMKIVNNKIADGSLVKTSDVR